MIIGDPLKFAVESHISKAYRRLSFRGLGYFVLHIGGERYGLHEPEATMLACAFDDIGKRVATRGEHVAPFSSAADATEIVASLEKAWSDSESDNQQTLGMPADEFVQAVKSDALLRCVLDRLYDEAFDDGSRILHFDVGNRVRLIACRFMMIDGDNLPDPSSVRDVWLTADEFYGILSDWHHKFELEWLATPKVPENA